MTGNEKINTPLEFIDYLNLYNQRINRWWNFNNREIIPIYDRNNEQRASILPTPFGNISYSDAFFDLMKSWLIDLNNTWIKAINSYEYPDLRIFLPRAFFIDWSDPKIREKEFFNPTIWFPSLYTSKEDQNKVLKPWRILGDFIIGGDYVGGNKAVGDYAEGNISNKRVGRDNE
jgi:hypothetical protein